MPYKTILVHLTDDPNRLARLDCAVGLADRFGAHVTALYLSAPIATAASMAGTTPAAALAAMGDEARERAAEVEDACRHRCLSRGVQIEWRPVVGVNQGDIFGHHALYADLTLAGRRAVDEGPGLPDDALLVTGGPVLLLPPDYAASSVGSRPLVAWKNARESARAMRDALPFLIEAEDVTILTVREEGGADLPGTHVAGALARHGVSVELRNRTSSAGRAGDVILAEAADRGCDMVVMGAYGRGERRRVVLGDVTHHMLRHAPMPLLVSY